MDSGNSGSLQSSSGGDEEYDSRAADSVSTFMTGGPISNPHPPFFDPLSNYLQLHQNPTAPLFNSGSVWPRTQRPGPNPNTVAHDNIMLPSSSTFMPSFQPPSAAGIDNTPALAPPPNQNSTAARNPKKRSRASRRAPTTVLTTDTTNFRAMVQEFTGIPAPPFSNSSFPRSRLDFFSSAAQPPPYLRRPFPQKIQPQHSLLTSAALDAITSSSPISNHNTTPPPLPPSNPSINYQITQNSNQFNIQNPILSTFLQSNPKFPFSTSPIQSNINHPNLSDQFSLNHGNQVSETLTTLPNLIPSDQNAARWNDNHAITDTNKDEELNLRSLNGSYSRMNFPATSTSNFRGGKAPENVTAARGEGMVESWICSSE